MCCRVSLQLIAQIRGGCRRKSITADQSSPSSVSQAATLLVTTAVIHMATAADQSTSNFKKLDHEFGDACAKTLNQNCSKLANACEAMFDRCQSTAVSKNNDEAIISGEEQHKPTEVSTFTPSIMKQQRQQLPDGFTLTTALLTCRGNLRRSWSPVGAGTCKYVSECTLATPLPFWCMPQTLCRMSRPR